MVRSYEHPFSPEEGSWLPSETLRTNVRSASTSTALDSTQDQNSTVVSFPTRLPHLRGFTLDSRLYIPLKMPIDAKCPFSRLGSQIRTCYLESSKSYPLSSVVRMVTHKRTMKESFGWNSHSLETIWICDKSFWISLWADVESWITIPHSHHKAHDASLLLILNYIGGLSFHIASEFSQQRRFSLWFRFYISAHFSAMAASLVKVLNYLGLPRAREIVVGLIHQIICFSDCSCVSSWNGWDSINSFCLSDQFKECLNMECY